MSLLIQKEGIFTSVQDLGRFGLQRFGINPRGAMDRTAVRIINLLLGNDEDRSVLEIHFPGPEILFENTCRIALGGADFAPELSGKPISNWQAYAVGESSILRFRNKNFGNRAYLAIGGGLSGSDQSWDREFETRRLQKGERLLFGPANSKVDQTASRGQVAASLLPAYSSFPTVRIIAGAEFDRISDAAKVQMESADFLVSNDSNRMGFRLQGPALHLARPIEMVSSAVNFGTIQLLPDGQMVVLMADHQTSGGYPRLAHVVSFDLPLLAQLGPGDKIAFRLVEIDEAERFAAQLETDLQRLKVGVRFGRYW